MTGPDRDGSRPDGAPEPTDAAGVEPRAGLPAGDLDALLAADALDALDADDRALLDALLVGDGVERVRGEQLVGVDRAATGELGLGHAVTPIRCRRRIIPSRNRVFTVPSGTPSRSAISDWVSPP